MSFGFLGEPGEPNEPFDMRSAFNQMSRIFASLASDDGPIPVALVRQSALDGLKDLPSAMTRSELDEAFRLADLWLDEVTQYPATSASVLAWGARQWVEESIPVWIELVTPIAEKMASAMTASMQELSGELGVEGGAEQWGLGLQQMQPILERIGGAMFAGQLGQALSRLASEVFGSSDVGIPVTKIGQRVLLPGNVEAWTQGLEIDKQQALLFAALREAAAVRLFSENPWLRSHLIAAIHAYAAGITIDVQALQEQAERAMEQLQGGQSEASREPAGIFEMAQSPAQRDALLQLETLLALIEGWIDHVVHRAASERLPEFSALAEMVRRRRAAGGPAEAIFATLVGLELRPRRLRDAVTLWAALEHEWGAVGRDDIWNHPESLPTRFDLDDPLAFVEAQRLMRNIPDDLSSLE